MTRKDIIGSCLIALLVLGNFWTINDKMVTQEKLQKTIDMQSEMLYTKNREIEFKELRIQSQGAEILKQEQEIRELQEQVQTQTVSRGSGRIITCEVSAYSCGDGMTPSAMMASGETVFVGACACNFLPFGTQVRIGDNIYTVLDRCGIDDCIDIYMSTSEECLSWGRRTMEVEIL